MKSKRNQSHQNSTPSHLPEATIALADYVAHTRNYNGHSDQQLTKLRASLRKFGQVKNIVIWRNMFVAGHGLAQAARLEGWTTLRANVIPEDWPEERVLAYLAADNELARQSDPDQAALAALIDEVGQFDPELMLAIGYSRDEFEKLLAEVGGGKEPVKDPGADVSKADELQAKWQVAPGDIWRLGTHRLVCGDCTDKATVERLMGGEKADALMTDPPYGIGVDKSMNEKGGQQYGNAAAPKRHYAATDWDTAPPDKATMAYLVSLAKQAVLWGGNYFDLPPARCYLVWDKQNDGNQFADCELAWTNLDKPVRLIRHMWNGMIRKGGEERLEHPTQKPAGVIAWAIQQFEQEPEIILDCYAGSGTTLIACEQLGRQARCIEISPAYCSVILERWSVATNQTPVRLEPNP